VFSARRTQKFESNSVQRCFKDSIYKTEINFFSGAEQINTIPGPADKDQRHHHPGILAAGSSAKKYSA
jgi:hypothetical protein